MQSLQFYLLIFLTLCVIQIKTQKFDSAPREFRVDYENNRFLKDGQPFRFVSGSFHYYRALPDTWRPRLRTMRAAGLNAVTTYVDWALHNPKPDTYVWTGMGDLVRFIREAAEEDLLVILRPGPYICSERENGGFPYWLFTKYPKIKLRTSDKDYLTEVRIWYEKLFEQVSHLLYSNGGPIIMVQVENEYASTSICEKKYTNWIRDETQRHVNDKALLFTNDGPPQLLVCGKIENVFATLDFGIGDHKTIDDNWNMLRKLQPNGPLVNVEFYPGWLTHWQENLARVKPEPVVESFRYMMDAGASVSFLMFVGGTNFGFTAGANDAGPGKYQPDITSYDFDSPVDEAGDPTPKYMMLRDAIKDYLPLPNISVPTRAPKLKLPPIRLDPKAALLSPVSRQKIGRTPVKAVVPKTFEELDQYSGFVLYETTLPVSKLDPAILSVSMIMDRAIVLVDGVVVGILSRQNKAFSIALNAGYSGKTLQILVENQGRINFIMPDDRKGLRDVKLNDELLKNWTLTGFPLEDVNQIEDLVNDSMSNDINGNDNIGQTSGILNNGPIIYHTTFDIGDEEIYDTFVDPTGWGKGVLFINGFNLGRYWPLAGPQISLYLPKQLLRKRKNSLILIELQKSPEDGFLKFSDKAIFVEPPRNLIFY